MTPSPKPVDPAVLPGPKDQTIGSEAITVDDIKRHAEAVRNAALDGVKQTVDGTLKSNKTAIIAAAVGVAVVGMSVAYFLGRSTAKRLAEPWCPPGCVPRR